MHEKISLKTQKEYLSPTKYSEFYGQRRFLDGGMVIGLCKLSITFYRLGAF